VRVLVEYEELNKKLKNIKKIDKEIQTINYEIQYLEEGLFRKSNLTEPKVTKSSTKDIADIYNAKAMRKEKLIKRIDTLMSERDSLISLIDDNLDDPEQRAVLKMFFCSDKNFYEIQDFFGVAERTLFRLKRKALQELAKQL
jgi:DNA-directed RNA polymerase specialized sigma subunit